MLPSAIDFSEQNTVEVARALLGHYLCFETEKDFISGVIVETEAYLITDDPACHASRGMTKRNEVMFGLPGFAYIYLIYGNYYCFNVVTGPEGTGEAVLVRAVEPVAGIEIMHKNRGGNCRLINLANGPGKLCIAYGINKSFNGHNLSAYPLYLLGPDKHREFEIKSTRRIGISAGKDKLLRFIMSGSNYLSRRELRE